MVQQTHKSSNPASALKTIELIDRLVEAVPIYRLSCNMEPEAAKVAYEGMQEYIVNDSNCSEQAESLADEAVRT